MRLVSVSSCYGNALGLAPSLELRDCDWAGALFLNLWCFVNFIIFWKTYHKHDRNTAFYRAFVLAFGMPMGDAWERGNIILVCFTCFILAHGPLLKSARLKWLLAGLAVNFKVYLIASIAPYVLRRRWRWFEGALAAVVLVYVITWGILGRGDIVSLYQNIVLFSEPMQATSFLDIWYAATYQPIMTLLNGMSIFPVMDVLGSRQVEAMMFLLPLATRLVQVTIVAAMVMTYFRPEVISTYRLINLFTSLAIITSEPGGYTTVIVAMMTLFERWEGVGRRIAIISCYILCIQYDIFIDPLAPRASPGFLNAKPVIYQYWVTAGPFIRPGVIMLIAFSLACVTIRTVWIDIRTQGWKGRHRYRFDAPILANGGRKVDVANAPKPA